MNKLKLLVASMLLAGCAVGQVENPWEGQAMHYTTNGNTTTVSVDSMDARAPCGFRMGRPVDARLGNDGKWHCFSLDRSLSP